MALRWKRVYVSWVFLNTPKEVHWRRYWWRVCRGLCWTQYKPWLLVSLTSPCLGSCHRRWGEEHWARWGKWCQGHPHSWTGPGSRISWSIGFTCTHYYGCGTKVIAVTLSHQSHLGRNVRVFPSSPYLRLVSPLLMFTLSFTVTAL